MPDTDENRADYPATVAEAGDRLSDDATGRSDLAFDWIGHRSRDRPDGGKGSGESSLLRDLLNNMNRGDVFIADRYYPSFSLLAELGKRGIDMVSVSHSSRVVDFSKGEQLGPQDHIVEWRRPANAMHRRPMKLPTRRFRNDSRSGVPYDVEGRNGRKEKAVVISTTTDPIPQKELSDLYWKRWGCELDFRAIKQSMQMDVLRSKTPEMAHKELWAGILAYNLLRGTMSESAKRTGVTPRELSVKGTMQTVESFTPAMMAERQRSALRCIPDRRLGSTRWKPTWTTRAAPEETPSGLDADDDEPRNEHFRRLASEALESVP